MAGKIDGIALPAELGASLGGSPEDAAKAFMRAASQGLARVMADAVQQALGEVVGGLGGPIPDWTKLVRGFVLDMDWETPPATDIQTVNTFATGGDGALGGFEVSIGGTIRF